jgi:hypothetical protein
MSASLKRSLSLGFWTKILYFCLIFLLHTVSQGCTDFLKIWELPKNSAPEWWHEGRALQGSTNLCNIIQTLVTTVTWCLGFMHPCVVSQASHPRFNFHNNPYPTSVKLFFVATVRSSPRDGPLNHWACLTTRLFKSLGVFNDALDNTRL